MLIIMIMLCFVLLQSAQCGYLQNKHEKNIFWNCVVRKFEEI